ncbi:MAG TPA: class I SAM-dependent methyltransferase [Candidatus Binataceae bacterium]|nr:class I SAM-dependent methyltransferase [Candidatus Binataceae bacterium]
MAESWEDRFKSLRASRVLTHNADYLEFLVTKVWRIDREPLKIAEFGCGYGRFASMVLPLLWIGSSYTGFDSAATLVSRGKEIFAESPYPTSFIRGEVHHAPLRDGHFDVTIAHLVLMHVPDPRRVLREMIRVTRPGGLLIACDANRNGHNALLHIEETNEQEEPHLELVQTVNRSIRRESGVDYNIGMKTPILMHHLGLENVQARVSDAVALLFPPVDTPEKEQVFRALCSEGLGYQPTDEAEIGRWRQALIKRGVSPETADKEIERERERDFAHKGKNYHTVSACVFTFSFGTVEK